MILVTGANGQVGSELRAVSDQFPQFEFLFTSKDELDISNERAVKAYFAKNKISYLINCAAYTAVDKAEKEKDLAHLVNVKAVSYLATACQKQNATLIHLSTDYVYHGAGNKPFKEAAMTDPQCVYAATKLAGERMATGENENTLIIRTSWVYSTYGHNFVKTMLRLGQERDRLSVVFDQIGTPTNAADLAVDMLNIIVRREAMKKEGNLPPKAKKGIFHYSNEGVTSWYDFAHAIFTIKGIDCQLSPIETKDYPTPASRPPFSVLNKNKVKSIFGLEIPHWNDSLKKCLATIE